MRGREGKGGKGETEGSGWVKSVVGVSAWRYRLDREVKVWVDRGGGGARRGRGRELEGGGRSVTVVPVVSGASTRKSSPCRRYISLPRHNQTAECLYIHPGWPLIHGRNCIALW